MVILATHTSNSSIIIHYHNIVRSLPLNTIMEIIIIIYRKFYLYLFVSSEKFEANFRLLFAYRTIVYARDRPGTDFLSLKNENERRLDLINNNNYHYYQQLSSHLCDVCLIFHSTNDSEQAISLPSINSCISKTCFSFSMKKI